MLAFMALTPMCLGVVATATSYGFTHALLFLFIATVLRAAYSPLPTLSWGTIIALLTTTIGLALVNQGYFPLLLLYLLIPIARLGSHKRYWLLFSGLVVIALAGNFAWETIVAGPPTAANPIVIQARQLIEQPRQIGQVLRRGVGAPVPLVAKTFGGPLVTDIPNVGPLVSMAYVIMMLVIAFLDFAPGVGRISFANRLIPWAAAALGVVAITLLSYLNLPYAYFAQGVHPRQIIPLAFVFLLFFLNAMPHVGKIGKFARGHLGWLVALYFVLRMCETLWVLNHRYYSLSS
jgi:uncharacterized membrane protein